MNQDRTNEILALLAGTEAPAPVIPNGIRANDTYDFNSDPFAAHKDFTFLGHIPAKSSRDITESMVGIGFETLDRDTFDPFPIIPLLGKSGVKHARCQTGWIKCEKTPGVYDFGWLDAIVDALLAEGIQPWFNVSYGNPLYTPNREYAALWDRYTEARKTEIPGPARGYTSEVPLLHGEEAMQAFLRYADALAAHFKGRVTVYEIWNEPEYFWHCDGVDHATKDGTAALARNYTELVRRTGEVIRQTDPNAKIAANSCSIGNSYINELGYYGLGNYIDIYTYHYYGNTPEAMLSANLAQLRACLQVPGKELTIWQGESGRASGNNRLPSCPSQYNQAKFLVRRLISDAAQGIPVSSIFTASDFKGYYEDGSNQQFGMFTVDNVMPKLSYYVLQGLAALLEEVVPDPRILVQFSAPPRIFEDTYAYRFDGASLRRKGVPLFALWRGGNNDIPHTPQYGVVYLHTRAVPEIRDLIAIDPIHRNVYRVNMQLPKPQAIAPAITLKNFPVTDYPVLLTDLRIFEDFL